MSVHLQLLNRTTVVGQGELTALPLGKPLALLIYLRATKTPTHRDDLASLFWSSEPKRARASLRNALWTIRDRLGEDVIETDGELVRANADLVSLDLDDLRHAIKSGDASEAIDLWGRGLLPDLAISGSPGWDRWVEELEDQLSEPLRVTVEEVARTAEPAQARRYGAFLATTFPWRSDYWTAWVQTCLDAADVACAEEALAAARRHPLNDDVQSELDELADRVEAARRAVAISDEDRLVELPMVGRSKVLARLRTHIRQDDGPSLTAISGPAGVGKTRLANEFLRGETDATVVRTGSSESDVRTPWGLVVSLARELASCEGAAGISIRSANALARIAPSLGPQLGASSEAELRDRRVESVTIADAFFDLVEAVAEQQQLIVFVDDLHWTDTASRDVLLRIGRMTRTDLRIVVTSRSGDADRATIGALQLQAERQWAVREELGNLRRSEVREAIGLAITLEPPEMMESLLDRVFDISAGNPLVINSLINEMKASDRLTWREPDGWVLSLDSVEQLVVPDSLRALLRERIATLGPTAHSLLSRLAHAERPRTVEYLFPEVTGPTRDGAVAELTRLQLAELRDDGHLYFPHEVTREIIRRAIPTRDRTSPGGSRVRRRGIMAAAVIIVIAAAAWGLDAAWSTEGGDLFPTDHSLVVFRNDGIALQYDFDPGTSEFVVLDSVPTSGLYRARRLADGRMMLSGRATPSLERGPDAALREWGSNESRIVFASDPDDGLEAVLPSGRFALVNTAEETDGWRTIPLLYDMDTGRSEVILRSSTPGSNPARLSPLGDRILLTTGAGATWALTSLRGDTLGTIDPRIPGRYGGWCGSDAVILGGLPPGGIRRYDKHDLTTGEATRLDLPVARSVTCTDDGRFLGFITIAGGQQRLHVRELESGTEISTALPVDTRRYSFVPDRLPPVPVAVEAPDSIKVTWGGEQPVDIRVLDQDGRLFPDVALDLKSTDPSVARVLGERIIGNRPGTAEVEVRIHGAHWSTIGVRVNDSDEPRGARWSDALDAGYAAEWIALGEPLPVPTDSALRLTGDGNYFDGIASRRAFTLPRGGTAEFEFRVPLVDRTDRQRVMLCLSEGEEGPSEDNQGVNWVAMEELCLRYPFGELALFDPGAVYLNSTFVDLGRVQLPDALVPDGGWTHMALELSADGFVSVAINRQLVFTSPVPMVADPGREWHIKITGAEVGTTAMIRDVVLWDGMRYRATPR